MREAYRKDLLDKWADLLEQSITDDPSTLPEPVQVGFLMLEEKDVREYVVRRAAEIILKSKELPVFSVVEAVLGIFISGLMLGWVLDDNHIDAIIPGFEQWANEGGVQRAIVRAAKDILREEVEGESRSDPFSFN